MTEIYGFLSATFEVIGGLLLILWFIFAPLVGWALNSIQIDTLKDRISELECRNLSQSGQGPMPEGPLGRVPSPKSKSSGDG